jgi:glycerol kinase
MSARYIVAVDQGTTSTRAIVFDHSGEIVGTGQREHKQSFPRAGWVEHDANEIRDNTIAVIAQAVKGAKAKAADVAAIGITNQRETAVIWDRATGEPISPAIVWQDTRTQKLVDQLAADGGVGRFREATGLPLATYFSATKIAWILDNVEGARARAEAGELAFGTTDTWVLWNLTGGPEGGVHATDVTNASRTLLMDLRTLDWDDALLEAFGVPRELLPEIRSSSEVYGEVAEGPLAGVPIAGILGDQQAATFGQVAFDAGESKNTYGTGNFLIFNTGPTITHSENGLITTVAYRLGDDDPVYALEGSIAVTGSLIQWLRDNLGLIKESADVEELALSVDDNGGVYFVPAFSGLFAPYWRPDARGVIVGLTRFTNKGPHRSRRPRGDSVSDARGTRRGEHGCRSASRGTARRRRHGRQRRAHAVPGRCTRRACRAACCHRDDRAGGRLRCRPRRRLLEGPRRAARQLARGHPLGAAVG